MLWFVYFLSWLILAIFALGHRSRLIKQGDRVLILLTIPNDHLAVVSTSWNRWTSLREFLVLSLPVISYDWRLGLINFNLIGQEFVMQTVLSLEGVGHEAMCPLPADQ